MPILVTAFPEVSAVGKRVAKLLGAEYASMSVGNFPDLEYHLKIQKNPRQKTVVIISSMAKDPDSKLVETVLAGGIAKDYMAKKVILVATYMPYLRQDTHFLKYDSFSSKYVIGLLGNFDHIIVLDPHLHRIHKMNVLSKKAESISAYALVAQYIKKHFKGDYEIIGPDEESAQWSSKVAKLLKKKVVILKKTRFGDSRIKQKTVHLDRHKKYIIIDDIISTGKTLSGALEMAKKQGAKKLVCIGVHGLLVQGADKLIGGNCELITTNSVPNRYSKIDISPLIAETLKKYK